jgi:cell division protein FtsQ
MTIVRSKQKTPFTPAFVGGVLFFLLSLCLVIWFFSRVVVWVQDQQNAPIRQVKLYGDFGHIQPNELHRTLQQEFVGNYFHVNVDQVQQFLQQQPWVYQVAVRKQWPGTLVVVVTEHSPVAVWNLEYLLNQRGEVFKAPIAQLNATLPQLAGPKGSEQDALTMFTRVQSLLTLHQLEAASLSVSERFAWQLTLSNGIELKLGREDTLKRVQRFIDLYPSISKHKSEAIEQVDLRYDTGLAVRFAPAPVQSNKRKA